ncbi:hypothetical protein [Ruminococcus callidus]|jgi:hypothetical protein
MEEDFIESLGKGITFFTEWGGEESDVSFYNHFQFSEKSAF